METETCVNHPDRPGKLVCMKYQVRFCEACADCRDPKLYCKHRTACPIWFIAKDRENGWGQVDTDEDFPSSVTCLFSNHARRFMPVDGLADLGEYTSKTILELIDAP